MRGWRRMNKMDKKGSVQNLFPAEGETVPALRFAEFEGAGSWEEKTLGELCSVLKGSGLSKSKLVEKGKYKCVLYGELFTKYTECIKQVESSTNFNEGVLSVAGDILIPASTTTSAKDLAKATLINQSNVLLGGDINIVRPINNKNINSTFLVYLLTYSKKDIISKLAQGITIIHLYGKSLKNLAINYPSLPEQQKIADCLSSIDDLITAQKAKIEELKTHKKGLMQQLFPAVDEVNV